VLWWLTTLPNRSHRLYILTYDVIPSKTNRTDHRCICRRDQHGLSHPLSGAVAYSNRLDGTTAYTLRLLATDTIQVNNAQRCADNVKLNGGNFVHVEYRNRNTKSLTQVNAALHPSGIANRVPASDRVKARMSPLPGGR